MEGSRYSKNVLIGIKKVTELGTVTPLAQRQTIARSKAVACSLQPARPVIRKAIRSV